MGTDSLTLAPTSTSPSPAPVASEAGIVSPKPAAENDEHAVANARTEQDDTTAGQWRRALLDDMPLSLKRRKHEDDPVGAEKLAQVIMSVVLRTSRRDRLDEDALRGLSALTNKVVSGGCIHALPVAVCTIRGDTRPRTDCPFHCSPRAPAGLLTMKLRERLRKLTRNGSVALSFTRTGQSEIKSKKSTLTRGVA